MRWIRDPRTVGAGDTRGVGGSKFQTGVLLQVPVYAPHCSDRDPLWSWGQDVPLWCAVADCPDLPESRSRVHLKEVTGASVGGPAWSTIRMPD